ncbi:chromate transporter [Petroclostridium sp. X23]|uniref:chromate transporter n=1 Tax=Petroclostridium sp. X23 TaxID=3045146 RepID=UPI0024ADD8B2|nr:chromate transporter [Petroclostridium sp. X23]WHH61326.1 chromate transporter [Petroclostridium sp. X23]
MILFKLFWTFFKIGLFSFGGGYAMIPLIQEEIQANGWIEAQEFADIVAISQMTPGPIAVNAATYIGVKTAGVLGSVAATLGVSLPSFILVILIAGVMVKFKQNSGVESVLRGIRPVTIGLISSAVLFFAEMSIFTDELPFERIKYLLTGQTVNLFEGINIQPGAITIFLIILVAVKKFKLNPILAVISSAVLGVLLI